MSASSVQILLAPLPGQRVVEGEDPEDGSVLAYRKDGDEALFASWYIDEDENKPGKGMVWIPVGEFSPDPEAIKPAALMEEEPGGEDQPASEQPSESGPFGRPRPRGRSQRPGV